MPLPCPTCGCLLVPVPAVLVSGPALPAVAECERGHQVELASGGAVAAVPVLEPGPAPLTWPAGALQSTVVADIVKRAGFTRAGSVTASGPWQHPDADVAGDMRRWFEHMADQPMRLLRRDDYPPTSQ